jgi:catechol 2,3-dioxygenase-like lactoylglutathione lyase family enzyme
MPLSLNHLNLVVRDLAAAQSFFERHFGFAVRDRRGNAIVVLDDGHGFTLVLSSPPRSQGEAPVYPDGFHVGFLMPSAEDVDAAHRRLTDGGVNLPKAPREMRGTYGFYFQALDGILFEIAVDGVMAAVPTALEA